MKFKKVISSLIIFAITLEIIGMILIPSPVVADTENLNPELNSLCWREVDCYNQRALFGIKDEKQQMAGCIKDAPCDTDGWCKCLPAGKSKTSIGIGGKRDFQHIGEYIRIGFNYAIMMAGVIAVLMIVVSGIQWMVSGGDKNTIGSAKKRIGGAFVGLFLAYGSIFILNQINPALTSLRLPQVWMVRQIKLKSDDRCPTSTKKKTTQCEVDCDCWAGWTCVGMKEGWATKLSKSVVWGAVAVVGEVVAPAAVAGGKDLTFKGASRAGNGVKNLIIRGTRKQLDKIAKLPEVKKYIIEHPIKAVVKGTVGVVKGAVGAAKFAGKSAVVTAAAGGSYIMISKNIADTQKKVENGQCIKIAQGTITAGGLCAWDKNCISGKCDMSNPLFSSWYTLDGSQGMGVCTGDKEIFTGGAKCSSKADCAASAGTGTYDKLACIGGLCSWGDTSHTCCWSHINPANLGEKVECEEQFNCIGNDESTGKPLVCGFNFGGVWYATGKDYSSAVDCAKSENTAWCNVYKNVIKNGRGFCRPSTDFKDK